ncbi:MAG TPA: S8 family peptidase, partial [Herpetosiphonaceae bacterium]
MKPSHHASAHRFFVGLLLAAMVFAFGARTGAPERLVRVIVQGSSASQAGQMVSQGGGTVMNELEIIDGVSASVPASAIRRLELAGLRVTPDYGVLSTGASDREGGNTRNEELYPSAASGTMGLADRGITGEGVTIAYVDSGFPELASAGQWDRRVDQRTLYAEQSDRFVVYRDLLHAGGQIINSSDPYGHGTHIVMTSADNRRFRPARGQHTPVGIAPEANIVMVRALDAEGKGSYSTVIEAIDWIVANKNRYGIRVLNLSIDSYVLAPYWADPLNQAVMKAWQADLTVIAAAGNRGPQAMTVGVPGNNPYVITVGAIKSGRYTDSGYDQLAGYSGAGPTESRFVKPDVVTPASQTIAVMGKDSALAGTSAALLVDDQTKPQLKIGNLKNRDYAYYKVSGTSMAAAQVSGIVALMLQDEPNLTNNQIKQRLTATALPAGTGTAAGYSIWQQGAGRVQAALAVDSTSTASANQGMNIAADLNYASGTHYLGSTVYDEATGTFKVQDGAGSSWSGGGSSWSGGGSSWSGAGSSWSGGYLIWNGGGSSWSGAGSSWAGAAPDAPDAGDPWFGMHAVWG